MRRLCHTACQSIRQAVLGSALAVVSAAGASNVDPAHSWSRSAFIGDVDWRPNSELGASINQFYCSGFLHGAQIGWIQIGSGAPLDGVRFRNDSADDFGVNVLPGGELRGFAYGANIGWIAFEQTGNPRVDWSTGRLAGKIYSANAGWIWLDEAGASVRVESIGKPQDLDGDSLPDAWEISRAGSLTVLAPASDSDLDGQTDRDEFLAGTNPLDRMEKLGPILLVDGSGTAEMALQWPSKAGHLYQIEKRSSLEPGSAWQTLNPAPVLGVGGQMQFALSPQALSPGFFRVRAFPPLSKIN